MTIWQQLLSWLRPATTSAPDTSLFAIPAAPLCPGPPKPTCSRTMAVLRSIELWVKLACPPPVRVVAGTDFDAVLVTLSLGPHRETYSITIDESVQSSVLGSVLDGIAENMLRLDAAGMLSSDGDCGEDDRDDDRTGGQPLSTADAMLRAAGQRFDEAMSRVKNTVDEMNK